MKHVKVRFKEATSMEPRKIDVDAWGHRAVKVMCEAWLEMNTVRARDGVPRGSNMTQEYWDSIMVELDRLITERTGKVAHCNPALYKD